ncbi:putative Lantibiotic dehydratase [Vibrio nigripulchritudo SFn27]|uniref:Putative Lantibiotic dehydratase n=1 Tax=Vibrio nigripulchritudo TaxID=28173 RepID=U4K852_9VIBR|nr:lantibiotic dehydratase [Vibrio nigripulchritudo]CCN81365.1 putative Lantibiotic dehydratase [Vibrio nigripulchritudo BLFn1]CCN91220.1 putative Lantibiotic dehydratase [Vibrio nigripulchritudo SFn27]CCN96319.1 putative Lantibiotic dehydratase [Vibrio nigripulchritudo ENn2]CCO38535.1 putative Lantibiotic dehydratase [Vibrio nigripulchritudo SFn135]CCO50436.1 putative Lantibiotic dehydratase [Vibrio nigripulchritudo Wn13]
MTKVYLTHDDFFVLRTPSLPVCELEKLNNAHQTEDVLNSWLENATTLEALYLASPSLVERLRQNDMLISDSKIQSETGKKNRKLKQSLIKYMIRMCFRATPFGLFSGIGTGGISSQTKIESSTLHGDSRKTRLDSFYLFALKEHISKNHFQLSDTKYQPNQSLYNIGDQYRYIEAQQSKDALTYQLSSVEIDEYVSYLVDLAKNRPNLEALTNGFLEKYVDADKAEVESFVLGLISESLLTPDIPLPFTGISPDLALIETLTKTGQLDLADTLSTILDRLKEIDANKGTSPDIYKQIYQRLKKLPVDVEESKLFQTDSFKHFDVCMLGDKTVNHILSQAQLLKSLCPKVGNPFSEFIRKFNERFEGQFVPLAMVLDEENGIGFSSESSYDAPLISGLPLGRFSSGQSEFESNETWDKLLHRELGLNALRGSDVIQLSSEAILHEIDETPNPEDLPASFMASVSLYLNESGEELIKLNGFSGPSAADLLGRFCHLDDELKHNVRQHLKKEEAQSEDVIFAEIVHVPEGRDCNVIARPHLRDYEIVFLADSSLPDENQIPLSDLYVWVEDSKVKLWSRRLKKQVIPRLSCAHNYSFGSLGEYKFLNMIPNQYALPPILKFPKYLDEASFSPRIMIDNIILAEKTWRIPRAELQALKKNSSIQKDAWKALQEKYRLENIITIAHGDNVIQLDLRNPMMLDILLNESRNDEIVELKESLPFKFDSPVKDEFGQSYNNEALIPILNKASSRFVHYQDDPDAAIAAEKLKRRFSPGSEWLSLKIYSGNSAVEDLLTEKLFSLIKKESELFERWFFIRYADPDWHIRIRFQGEPTALWGSLLPKLNALLDPMVEAGELQKTELSTYEREVERYGGPSAISHIEKLFNADSELVTKTLKLESETESDLRYRLSLLHTDQLLNLFGYSCEDKLKLLSELRDGYGHEFKETKYLRKKLGEKYSDVRDQVDKDMSLIDELKPIRSDDISQHFYSLIRQWRDEILPSVEKVLELGDSKEGLTCSISTLLGSVIHMHNNRLFKAYGREHELVMHDFLRRNYFFRQSRKKHS